MVDKRYLPSRWGKTFAKVILQHSRVAKHIHWRHMSKRLHFWCKELVSPSGETHGPLITVGQIDNVKEHHAKGDVGEEALLCVVLLEGAPEPREYHPFVEAYESSAAQAKLAEATRREEKERAKTSCKKGVKELLDTLRGRMDERWKECIFDHEMVDQWTRGGKRKQSTVKFHVGFVDDLLKPYVAAPSMAKKKKVVADLASEINQRMGQVWTLGRGQADAQQSENNAEPSTAHHA
ncbi:hypothetical protein SEMRO_2502_G329540.1 [Seminavis robusta]|uniref:Uncharacterized protein n=1 Tax=Seminavis robusta TaxID=568900 RepID=A0A9N8HYH6_9STRA|nr:hypothetical protein SEMRO_2502_G329540.1 [Seminavis robusta]|eukprot:Sro2502_g329540.1 n/a (236) ;mRNA; r:13305-14012